MNNPFFLLRDRLQVERAEQRCILYLLDRSWRSTRGGWRVTAGSFTTGAPLTSTLRASSGWSRPGGCQARRAIPSTGVWSILYGTVDQNEMFTKRLYYKMNQVGQCYC